jgi:hypothetical protein
LCAKRLDGGILFQLEIPVGAVLAAWTPAPALDHEHSIKTVVTTRYVAKGKLLFAYAAVACHSLHFFVDLALFTTIFGGLEIKFCYTNTQFFKLTFY